MDRFRRLDLRKLLAARYYSKQASTKQHHSKDLMARKVPARGNDLFRQSQRREDMLPSQEPVEEFRRVNLDRVSASLEGSPELGVIRNRP